MDNETLLRRLELMKKTVKGVFHFVLIGLIVWFCIDNWPIMAQLASTKGRIYFLLVVLAILAFYNFLFHKKIFDLMEMKRLKRQKIAEEESRILGFLNLKFDKISSKELEEKIASMKLYELSKQNSKLYQDGIIKQKETAKNALERLKHKEAIESLTREKTALEADLRLIEKQKRQELWDEDQKLDEIRRKLNLSQYAFLVQDLDEDQINFLKGEEYVQTNEYDINQKRVIPVLVKKVLNHSSTHTFLVWSVMKYVKENLPEAVNLQEHETKDADITLKYDGKYYALEIETGTLLEKPRQLAEKVAYLNTKYRKRWMFIVSNKELVSRYRKYAPSTPRNQVEENLRKLLENNHPTKTGGKQ